MIFQLNLSNSANGAMQRWVFCFFWGGSQPPKMARKMPPKAKKKPMDLFKNVGTDIPLFYSCWSNPWFMYWGYKETLPTKVLTIPPPAPKEKRKVGPSKLWKRNSGNHTILGKLVPKPEFFGDFGEVPLLNHHLG